MSLMQSVYFADGFMVLKKTKYLCRVTGKTFNEDDRDEGNAKITEVKKTELNMRTKYRKSWQKNL